jgi:phospholipid transport system transporter-binding protein
MRIEVADIGMDNAAQIAAAGAAAIESGDVEIDLSAVSRCDSSAVALLLAWHRLATTRGVSLQVLGGPAALASLVSVYGVGELIAPALGVSA